MEKITAQNDDQALSIITMTLHPSDGQKTHSGGREQTATG